MREGCEGGIRNDRQDSSEEYLHSIAISLKRIADTLEHNQAAATLAEFAASIDPEHPDAVIKIKAMAQTVLRK